MMTTDGGAAQATQQPQAPTVRLPQTPSEKAEGETIVGIEPEDNSRIASDDVLSYIKEKVGQPFKVEALAQDVRSLWDSGFFEDVQVDMQEVPRGVRLRFKVTERPNVKSVEFE